MSSIWASPPAFMALVSSLSGCPACVKATDPLPSPPASAVPVSQTASASAQHVADATNVLKSPFDVEARRAAAGGPVPDPSSPPVVPPARDLIGVSFYIDKSHSVADPSLKRQNEEAVR